MSIICKHWLQVDVYMPNGVPAKGQKIRVKQINDNGGVVETVKEVTDNDGQALAIFENTAQNNRLRFKVCLMKINLCNFSGKEMKSNIKLIHIASKNSFFFQERLII
jgi:5-hydroxyisourate hydrolase-like protein (transthyretin family)